MQRSMNRRRYSLAILILISEVYKCHSDEQVVEVENL